MANLLSAFILLVALFQTSNGYMVTCEVDITGKICTLRNVVYDVIMFSSLTGISTVSIKDTRVSKVPQKVIDRFLSLEKLDLSKNAFTELNFNDITHTITNLQILDASSNNVTALAPNVFAPMSINLRELYLSRNQIQALPSTVFFSLPKLTLLDLSHNQIKTIAQDNIFGLLRSLRFIYLNHNGITKMRTSFANVTNLVAFDGSHNDLKDWSLTFASGSTVKLNLAYCGLKNSYSSAADKEELDLEGNQIEVMKITGRVTRLRANNNIIRQVEIDPSIQLEALELANNYITDISNITKVDNLQVLDLSGNMLKGSIKGNIFAELKALTYLNLKNTGATISPELLEKNSRLMFLDISSNRIGSFDLKTLKFLTNLEILRLDSNEMAELIGYEDAKEILPELNTIGLSNNMFSCSYLQNLTRSLHASMVELNVPVSKLEYIFPNIKGIKCIKDVANMTDQLVSMDNIINLQDEAFKDDMRIKMRAIQEDINAQKQSLNNHDQQLQDVSIKFNSSMKDLLENTKSQFSALKGSAGANQDILIKLGVLQSDVQQSNQKTDEKLDKISGSLESPKMDKLVTDTQGDIEGLNAKTKAVVVISVILMVVVGSVLVILLQEKYKKRFTSNMSYSEQQLTL